MTSLGLTVVPSGAQRRPGGRRPAQTPVSHGSKKWSAQLGIGWNCPSCKYYNFGFRTQCFGCKVVARPGGVVPPQGLGACKKNSDARPNLCRSHVSRKAEQVVHNTTKVHTTCGDCGQTHFWLSYPGTS
eukprot:1032466-Amphidinium_carterae.1